jgi:hypothetical protein
MSCLIIYRVTQLPSTEIGYGCNFESLLGISANSMKVLGIYICNFPLKIFASGPN